MRACLPSVIGLIVPLVPCLSGVAAGENWPQFRGPHASGIWSATTLPVEWGPDKNVAWKVTIPGAGWSQPIVWGDRIFVTSAVTENQKKPVGGQSGPGFGFLRGLITGGNLTGGAPPDVTYRWKVLCLDATTGKVVWERLAHEGRPNIPIHQSNTYASETPATDGKRVVAYFGMTGLYGYDLSGGVLWSKDLGALPMQFGWGTGSSAVLHGDRVFVQCDNEKSSFLIALNKETGDEIWRVRRDERSNWSTPLVWENKLRTELVVGGAKIRAYDPDDGELLWEMNGDGRCATTPVGNDALLYVGSVDRLTGRSGLLAAVRAGASGDISLTTSAPTNSFVAWSVQRAAPPLASPLLYHGCLYVLQQHGGIIGCFDAKTGKPHYRQRLPGAAGFTASPWANDGKVFCLDENGQTYVLQAGPKLEILATNKLDEMFWSSAAAIGNHLLLRSVDHLYCIGQ